MLDGQIACLILEADDAARSSGGVPHRAARPCAPLWRLLIFDEMIAGFRLSASGAQGLFGVTPDLSTFGKALGNGFAVSALAGRRDLMERGGIRHEHERVFLLSTTHGAETHALAAAIAVMRIHQEEDVPAQLRRLGQRLADGVAEVASAAGVGDHLITRGRPENLVFATLDEDLRPSQQYRTLFMRQLILGGVLGPSFVVSTALTDDDIDRTIDVVADACGIYCKALDDGDPTPWLDGRLDKARVPDIRVIGLSLPDGPARGAVPRRAPRRHRDWLRRDAAQPRRHACDARGSGRHDRAHAERRAEATASAAEFLPGADVDVRFGKFPDGRLPAYWEGVKQLLSEIRTNIRPQLIFAPRTDDAHQDHRLIGELVPTVWRDSLALHYEIPKWDGDLGKVSHYVTISEEIAARKVALLEKCFPVAGWTRMVAERDVFQPHAFARRSNAESDTPRASPRTKW